MKCKKRHDSGRRCARWSVVGGQYCWSHRQDENDSLRKYGQALYDLLCEHMPDSYQQSDSRMRAWRSAVKRSA